MDPLTIGLITGGASLLGSIFSSDTNAQNTQANIAAQQQQTAQSEAFNAQQADINRQFQVGMTGEAQQFNAAQVAGQQNFEQAMSNTAYQRAASDMKQAGLNPMMMFGSGGASSTPSVGAASSGASAGSAASIGVPNMALSERTSPFAGLGDAVSKVVNTAKAAQDLTQGQADIDLRRAQKHLTDEQALKTNIEGTATGQRSGAISDENAIVHAERAIKDNQATTAKNLQDINPTVRKVMDVGDRAAGTATNIGDAISSFIPGAAVLRRAMRGYDSRTTSETTSSDPGVPSSFTERFNY